MRWWFTTIVAVFVDVFDISNFVPPLLVQHNSNSVFVIFSCSHEYVFVVCLLMLRPICFFCNTVGVVSLLFVYPCSWFFFSIVSPHRSLLPLVILLLLPSFVLFDVLRPLTIHSLQLFLLLLPSLFSSSKFLKRSGASPSKLSCLSLPPPLPFRSSFLLVLLFVAVVVFTSHACWKVTVNVF